MNTNDKKHEMEDEKQDNLGLDKTPVTKNHLHEIEDDKFNEIPAIRVSGDGTATNLETGDPVELGGSLPEDIPIRVVHSVPVEMQSEDLTATEAMSEMEKWGRVECPFPPPVPNTIQNLKVWDEYREKKKEFDTAQREIMIAKTKKSQHEACMLDPKMDIEKHGFKMEKRNKSTDDFIFYKLITIHDGPDRNWEEHGYFVRMILLLPSGTVFLHVLDIQDRYQVIKKSEKEKEDRLAKLPCVFHGIVKNGKELDQVLEMVFMRDEIYDFYPTMEEPHQNFWIDLVIRDNNTKPAVN